MAVGLELCAAFPGLAQNADSGDLTEIVVTARRVAENLQDVPISISVFNQRQLTDRNITSITDLSAYAPSLGVDTSFGSDNATFLLRGLSQASGTAPTVAVYFDDVTAPRGGVGGALLHAGDGAGPGSFFDLQNVQVVKGPQGTLFGRNTTGGAVLLVPQKPTSEFGGYAEVSGGNYGMERTQAVINLPINDSVRLRLGFDRETRDGYLNNISGIGPSTFDDIDYLAARASLVVDITSNLENYTVASYSRSDTNGFGNQVFSCNPGIPVFGQLSCNQLAQFKGNPGYSVENDLPDAYSNIRQWQVINTTTWSVSDTLTFKNIASYAQYEGTLSSNLFGSDFIIPTTLNVSIPGGGVIPLPTGAAAGQHLLFTGSGPPPGGQVSDQETYTEELQLQGLSFGGRLTWQTGLYFEGSDSLTPQGTQSPVFVACTSIQSLQCTDLLQSILGVPFGEVQRTLGTLTFHDYAAYGQGTYTVADNLKLTGGLRYTEDHTSGQVTGDLWSFPAPDIPLHGCIAGAQNTATCHSSLADKSSSPTWLLGLDYTPVKDLLTYAKYARGYRTGGIVLGAPPGYDAFQPEHIDDYEVGEKYSFNGGSVSGFIDANAFYNKLSNEQEPIGFLVPAGSGLGAPTGSIGNVGKSRVSGVELDGALSLHQGLTLNLSYTNLNTRIEAITQPTPVAGSLFIPTTQIVVGSALPLAPHNKLSFTPSYRLPIDKSWGDLTVAATYTYTSKVHTDQIGPYANIPAYGLFNLNLNWESVGGGPIDAELFVTNVADHVYAISIGDFTPTLGFASREIGEPRMFGARLRYHFGNSR